MKAIFSKYGRWIEIILLLALISVVFAFGYNYAHKDTLLVQASLDRANEKIQEQKDLLDDLAAKMKKAKEDEAAAKAREKKANDTLNAFISVSSKKEKDFAKQTTDLGKKPDCVMLTEHLCPAAMGY